jgi:transposase
LRHREAEPNAENATLEELRVAMQAAPNRRSYIRLAVIRSLLMGVERSVVAQQFCRTDRVVRLWIEMFNAGGIDALTTKGRPGRGRRVKLERLRDLLVPVLENPRQAGELHWTGVKIHGFLKEQLGLEVGYSTTVRYLHELGYNLRVPRPWPERQNEEQRNAFLDQLRTWQADAGLELWFADECGVEGDPRPRRRWSARGDRPKVPYLGDHIRANVIGAVCPASGECCTMIFDGVDTDVFQYYLDFLAQEIPPLDSKRRLLIVDNASWHKAQRLNWHHFEVHYLPGYSPDFNPIERLWLRLKVDFFSDFIAKSPEQLTQRLCHALTSLMNDPETVASQCANPKIRVVRPGKIGRRSRVALCGLSHGSDLDIIAKILDALGEAVEDFERIEFVEEVRSKFTIRGFGFEDTVDGDGQRMGDGNDCLLFTAPCRDAPVLSAVVTPFLAYGAMSSLH